MSIDWENLGRTKVAPNRVFRPKRLKHGKRRLPTFKVEVYQVHWRKAVDDLLGHYRTGETSRYLGMGRTYLYYVESTADDAWIPSYELGVRILALHKHTFGEHKHAELFYLEKENEN